MSQVGWMVETKEKQPVLLQSMSIKKKKNLNKKEHIHVLILFLHRQRDREQSEHGMPKTESKQERTAGKKGNR